jgi:hypothetical protein
LYGENYLEEWLLLVDDEQVVVRTPSLMMIDSRFGVCASGELTMN